MPMKVLDMFCGMSVFCTAAELIGGFSFIGHCDNVPTAVATYRTLYKTEGEYFCNDARAVNTDEIPDFALLVGGFPCVAFSASGARRAFDDPQGTLFFELSRILEAKHPAYFIFENVPRSARFAKGAFLPRSSVSYLDWGICANGNVLTARLTFPKQESACSLLDILIPDVPEKYYLSREKAEKLFPNSQIISLRESESTTQAEHHNTDGFLWRLRRQDGYVSGGLQ